MASMTETMQVAPMETMQMKLQNKSSRGHQPQPPPFPKPKGKLRIDPQRALEPARKKLSTLESQRIMAVLAEAIRRSELLSSLPRILENLDRYSIALGTDLLKMLQDHKVILDSFEQLKNDTERLLEQQGASRQSETSEAEEEQQEEAEEKPKSSARLSSAGSITSQAEEAMRNLTLVAKQMQFSCKNILRGFCANPAAWTAVMKEDPGRSDPSETMLKELNELKDILMGMLLTTPVEEAERNQYLKEISERERYNAGIIEKLEAELQTALDDKDEEVRH
jgi:hypothetical protein